MTTTTTRILRMMSIIDSNGRSRSRAIATYQAGIGVAVVDIYIHFGASLAFLLWWFFFFFRAFVSFGSHEIEYTGWNAGNARSQSQILRTFGDVNAGSCG
jgi:hypothetical protein